MRPDLRNIGFASYLVDIYAEADDAYRAFETSGNVASLRQGAAVLCLGLTRLENDDAVWSGFRQVSRVSSSDREVVFSVLEDIEALVDVEVALLRARHPYFRRRDASENPN